MSVHEHFSRTEVDVAALGRYLDDLAVAERVRVVQSLSRREQAELFDAADGIRPIELTDMVPPGTPPLVEVIHAGRNSLPVFRNFEKRFCRPPEGGRELWGYNEHAIRWATGPGYFVARVRDPGELLLDYLEVPSMKPDGWPPVKSNSLLRGRFVYGGIQDVVRGVSAGVSAGRATRRGKPTDNWFVLCRRSDWVVDPI
jgi:hypothetical protein